MKFQSKGRKIQENSQITYQPYVTRVLEEKGGEKMVKALNFKGLCAC